MSAIPQGLTPQFGNAAALGAPGAGAGAPDLSALLGGAGGAAGAAPAAPAAAPAGVPMFGHQAEVPMFGHGVGENLNTLA